MDLLRIEPPQNDFDSPPATYTSNSHMALLISDHVVQCLQDFRATSLELRERSETVREKLLDEFARFKLWAGNIGAHRKGRSSLDWRLRDASHLRGLVVNLLTDLKSALNDILSILDKELNAGVGSVSLPNEVPTLEGYIGPDDEVDDDTEVLEITADIEDIIGCLLRLSVSIRNPAPHDHFMASKFIDTSYFEEYDVEHVKAKLRHVDPALAYRLGKAISQRRQYFKYRETHHQKLMAGLDLDSRRSEAGVQSTVASSIPTALKDSESSSLRLEEEETSNSGASQTSYATSGPDSGRLKIPPLPKQASDGPFECPYCYMMISVSTVIQWKRHVNADLRPYICLEPDCLTSEQQYAKRHEWVEHLNQKHWRVFRCPYSCKSADFVTPSHLENHLRQSHPEISSQKDLSMILNICKRSRTWPEETECPLCLQVLHSKREYARHVGRHQTELALFALPNTGEDINEDEEEENQSDDPQRLNKAGRQTGWNTEESELSDGDLELEHILNRLDQPLALVESPKSEQQQDRPIRPSIETAVSDLSSTPPQEQEPSTTVRLSRKSSTSLPYISPTQAEPGEPNMSTCYITTCEFMKKHTNACIRGATEGLAPKRILGGTSETGTLESSIIARNLAVDSLPEEREVLGEAAIKSANEIPSDPNSIARTLPLTAEEIQHAKSIDRELPSDIQPELGGVDQSHKK
ncbi:hypothetical protein NUW58_g3267 [Xylaria curta]|uniref:Uncharacterized protein n=1 Tax=Xylaria curta TaxID=42375 RepID=A0ACC1PDG4_9PEZI|nr:hypothetical protein NUW58_g3267 [Xylaria curta]